jgi:hypothetical protein
LEINIILNFINCEENKSKRKYPLIYFAAEDSILTSIFSILKKLFMKIIYLFALACVTLAADFILHRHEDNSARCLDGSPASLYYQVGVQSDKFVIYFEGGGLCRGDGLADMI